MNNTLILLILILCILSFEGDASDNLTVHIQENYGKEFDAKVFGTTNPITTDNTRESSRSNIVSAETLPILITRSFRPNQYDDFCENKLIEVLIEITAQKKGGLKQIEFWELPEDDLKLEVCSCPLRTTNISQLLDYGDQDLSILTEEDILNTTSIIRSLKDRSVNQHRKELNEYIYMQLSNKTIRLLNTIDPQKDRTNQSLLNGLLIDFNKIIENNSTDLHMLFFNCHINVDRDRVYSLNPNSSAYDDLKDYRLQKRLILEHIFPQMIRNLSILKDHECLKIFKDKNAIKIMEKGLCQGETLIFKYYLRPIEIGSKDIKYIVRSDGYLEKGTETISVSKWGEEFSIDCWCNSKDITMGDPQTFIYNIKYTGGAGEENKFQVYVQPPNNKCTIDNVSWEGPSNLKGLFNHDKHINDTWWSACDIPFSKGIIEKLCVTATFGETGLRISPPTIRLGNYSQKFETDLSVYAKYDDLFRIHYDFYTVLLTIAAILLSLIVAICSSVELYLAQREINLIHKEIDISNAVIERNNEIFRELIKKLK